MAGETVTIAPEVSSRLVTDHEFRGPRPPALVVRWVKWDSGFRAAGIRPGDRIVAVDGAPIAVPQDPAELSRALARMVGQIAEWQAWSDAGRQEGDTLRLTVRRHRTPAGWEEVELEGALRGERTWRNADNRPVLGPGGPDDVARDGFQGNWHGWYGTAATTWERAWARYEAGALVQLVDIDVDESAARVPRLAERYPGPFADAVVADWAALLAIVEGREHTLEPGALDFRQLGEQRAQEIRSAGESARAAFLQAHAAELIEPFPAIDPILDDRSAVAGKLADLPPISHREWVNQGDGTVLVFAQGDDCYVAPVSGTAEQMIRTQRRYEKLVRPSSGSRFAVVARLTADPTMLVYDDVARFALRVEPVAATVDDAFFVDLSTGADPAPFAGEELLRREDVAVPDAASPPEAVMAAMVGALKVGDFELWRSLYATWNFFLADDGRPVLSPWGPANLDSNWEQGRRRILDDVVDVRVAWSDDPLTVVGADAFEGAPTIEQCALEVEHVRIDPDGVARSFQRVGLTRRWTLQRLDGGPWRIATNAGI